MPGKTTHRVVYTYTLKFDELKPLLETLVVLEESPLDFLLKSMNPPEGIMKEKEEVALEIVKIGAKDEALEEKYKITYYNPETKRSDVLETTIKIRVDDTAEKKIEEALGMHSVYPVYAFITTPIIKREMSPYLLEQIIKEREYGTPPPFGGAAAIKLSSPHIVVEERRRKRAESAIIETIKRKERTEKRLAKEIIIMEKAIEELKKGKQPTKVLRKLGPLTRARFLAALRKRNLTNAMMILLMEEDAKFLRSMKKKLELLSFDDLLGLIRIVKELQKRE